MNKIHPSIINLSNISDKGSKQQLATEKEQNRKQKTAASTSTTTTTMASLVGFPNANAIQKPWQLPTLKPSSKPLQNCTLITCCALNNKPTTDAKELMEQEKSIDGVHWGDGGSVTDDGVHIGCRCYLNRVLCNSY